MPVQIPVDDRGIVVKEVPGMRVVDGSVTRAPDRGHSNGCQLGIVADVIEGGKLAELQVNLDLARHIQCFLLDHGAAQLFQCLGSDLRGLVSDRDAVLRGKNGVHDLAHSLSDRRDDTIIPNGGPALKTVRFMIVDDQQIIREGLAGMLSSEPDLELVGVAENGQEALELALAARPHLVLMDLRMPVMGGAQAIREIRKVLPQTRFVVLTVYDNDEELFEALRAGAKAFLLKDVSREELVSVMRSVAAGKAHLQPELTSMLLDRLTEIPDASQVEVHVTEREVAVLQLLAQGESNKEIAVGLSISEHTVKSHVGNILAKLEARDRTEAVTKAIQKGLIQI